MLHLHKLNLQKLHQQNNLGLTVTAAWLMLTALCFPFSVAATNLLLALALISGLVSGLLWTGIRELWQQHRLLAGWMLAYFSLLVIGLLWSLDADYGIKVVGHYWFWLALPVILAVMQDRIWRHRFLVGLSSGLALNLLYCVLQRFGLVVANNAGSWQQNATGHIGHISFGFIYGIWAAWLLHWGWLQSGVKRWLAWGLAGWAWVMIFAAHGRAGYIVAVLLIIVVIVKHAGFSIRIWSLSAAVVVLLGLVTVSSDGGRARMQDTFEKVHGVLSADVKRADPRWSFWLIGLEAWKQYPVLGVGTGGFPVAAAMVYQQHPELIYPGLESFPPSHPHNMYVLAASRWSIIGGIILVGWFGSWLWCGRQLGRQQGEGLTILVTLTGVACVIDSVFSPTPEQHFSGVFLAMMLGLGLSTQALESDKKDSGGVGCE